MWETGKFTVGVQVASLDKPLCDRRLGCTVCTVERRRREHGR
jgi:hypothetical protein